jgi:ribosome-binding protein aMBF1 (putative translation factor)
MAGHRPFAQLRATIDATPERAARVRALEEQYLAEQATYDHAVAELARARAYTHDQLARALGLSETQVRRIEDQVNLYVTTLQSYFEAMGGELGLATTVDGQRSILAVADLFADPETSGEAHSASA